MESGVDGFAAFYREFEGLVLRYFMGATRGRADVAADLAAETFACALESRTQFDPRLGRPDQWLFGIARNVLRQSYRHGRVDASARARLLLPPLLLDEESLAAIERLYEEEGDAMLALASLPAEQRYAVQARVLDDREYTEIAGELRCSEAVVRQRVSRGLRTLRRKLGGRR